MAGYSSRIEIADRKSERAALRLSREWLFDRYKEAIRGVGGGGGGVLCYSLKNGNEEAGGTDLRGGGKVTTLDRNGEGGIQHSRHLQLTGSAGQMNRQKDNDHSKGGGGGKKEKSKVRLRQSNRGESILNGSYMAYTVAAGKYGKFVPCKKKKEVPQKDGGSLRGEIVGKIGW